MVRPREFDREEALDQAMQVFWAKGYAATSTDDLLTAMNIGRQSLYNTFGDKRTLYLEALARYQQQSTAGHLARLNQHASVVAGLEALLLGLIDADDAARVLGCMGVAAICEFGVTDPELVQLRSKVSPWFVRRLAERIAEGQANGEIDPALDTDQTAAFVLMTMEGLQIGARAGSTADSLHALARFAIDRIRTR